MSFWIAVAVLSAITLFLLAAPLWRKNKEEGERADYELNVFKDQLKELDRDLERGLINQAEAETARVEIQRRLLAADEKRGQNTVSGQKVGTGTFIISAVVGLGLVAGSLALYLKIGMPGYEDVPFASRDSQKERQMASSEGMAAEIAQLKKHLENEPGDVEGWMLLGRTMRLVGRPGEAVDAYRSAVKASERHPSVLADFAESKIYASEGQVDDETFAALKEAVDNDPSQMKARFYLGFAKMKTQDYAGAIQEWTDLAAMAPKEIGWLSQVNEQIDMAAKAGNLNRDDFKPSEQALALSKQFELQWEEEKKQRQEQASQTSGPSQADMEAASEMTPEERDEMIRGMVEKLADRLKENPNDIEGWKRLAKVYMVLGEKDKALEARNKVKELSGS